MTFTALADALAPGAADRLGAVLADPVPASDPHLVACAVFVQDDVLVRVYQLAEGLVADGAPDADLAAALAAIPGVAEVEARVAPFLDAPSPSAADRTEDGLAKSLRGRLMRRVQQRIVRGVPASLSALRYRVRPGAAEAITEIFTTVRPEARPVLLDSGGRQNGLLHGVAVFVKGRDMVRVISYDGELADVATYMAHRPGRAQIEARLEPYLEGRGDVSAPEAFLRGFADISMDRLALSAPAAPTEAR